MERHPYVTRAIVDEFYYVYNKLGFGFLEQHYAAALEHRLRLARLGVVREYSVRVMFDGIELGFHRLDLVVQAHVVVELKATPVLAPHAKYQLMNYLRATNLEVGLLLHFGPEPKWYKLCVPNRS